jgi:hypothetical protein
MRQCWYCAQERSKRAAAGREGKNEKKTAVKYRAAAASIRGLTFGVVQQIQV